MPVDIPLNSRYKTTDVVRYKDQELLGSWPGFDWLNSEPWKIITIDASQAGRLDLIANQYYGLVDYWWAIMYYNNATNLNWPRAGDVVKLPSPSAILGT